MPDARCLGSFDRIPVFGNAFCNIEAADHHQHFTSGEGRLKRISVAIIAIFDPHARGGALRKFFGAAGNQRKIGRRNLLEKVRSYPASKIT